MAIDACVKLKLPLLARDHCGTPQQLDITVAFVVLWLKSCTARQLALLPTLVALRLIA